MKFQHVFTKQVLEVEKIEIVESYPKSFTIYVMENGERWEKSALYQSWREIDEELELVDVV